MHSDADNERRTRVDARKDHRQTISLRTVIETSVIKMNTLFERRSVRPKAAGGWFGSHFGSPRRAEAMSVTACSAKTLAELTSDLFRFGSPKGRGLIDQDNINLKGQFRTGGPYRI